MNCGMQTAIYFVKKNIQSYVIITGEFTSEFPKTPRPDLDSYA